MKNENKLIKLAITGYSWCGAKLGIVSEKQSEIEKSYNVDGIDIIVSDELEGAIRGAEIDYSTSLFTRGFEVTPIYSK
jgi:Fe-S cluster assembly iron-binding protein IscA